MASENGGWRTENQNTGLSCSSVLTSAPPIPEPVPNPELLSSLGRLVRGLSALFWGLPIALVVCVQTAKGDLFEKFGVFAPASLIAQLLIGVVPALVCTGLLFYGLCLLGHFQKQERVWRAALERAKLFGLINIGLSPFLYWWSRMPSEPFYNAVIELMMFSGLLFLFALNPLLWRLAAMLPDETLRLETKLFTTINRSLIVITLALLAAYLILGRLPQLPPMFLSFGLFLQRTALWLGLFLVLLPVAMTMALIWKMKEVILASVFGPEQ